MKKLIIYIANNFYVIVLIYIISVIISSLLFWIFENISFVDSIWWTFVTSLAIGYWDFVPLTPQGRIVWVIFWHFWLFFITPMIISNIVAVLLKDKNRFTDSEQEWIKDVISKMAENDWLENIPKIPKKRK